MLVSAENYLDIDRSSGNAMMVFTVIRRQHFP